MTLQATGLVAPKGSSRAISWPLVICNYVVVAVANGVDTQTAKSEASPHGAEVQATKIVCVRGDDGIPCLDEVWIARLKLHAVNHVLNEHLVALRVSIGPLKPSVIEAKVCAQFPVDLDQNLSPNAPNRVHITRRVVHLVVEVGESLGVNAVESEVVREGTNAARKRSSVLANRECRGRHSGGALSKHHRPEIAPAFAHATSLASD